MSKKGGKIKKNKKKKRLKPSQVLLATSGALGIGAAVSAPILGADVAATPLLGLASGLSLGASKIFSAFGKGLPVRDLKRLKAIEKRHAKGGSFSAAILKRDQKFLDMVTEKMNRKGAGISTGGSLKSGRGLRTGGNVKRSIGSKRQVWNGTKFQTTEGLTKDKLMKNKRGKIVSRKKHEIGMKMFKENNLKPKSAEEMKKLRELRK